MPKTRGKSKGNAPQPSEPDPQPDQPDPQPAQPDPQPNPLPQPQPAPPESQDEDDSDDESSDDGSNTTTKKGMLLELDKQMPRLSSTNFQAWNRALEDVEYYAGWDESIIDIDQKYTNKSWNK